MDKPETEIKVDQSAPQTPEVLKIKISESFFPSGAIAFFIVLVALCLVIWFGIYFLMLDRI